MTEDENGFSEWKQFILNAISDIKSSVQHMGEKIGEMKELQNQEITKIKVDLATLKVKIAVIGACGAILVQIVFKLLGL